ncbi:DNA ligase 3-like [Haliotis rufescens]|uniref:DNA ligase 3-like n=1 Tax=Haliotis rufescens TaxID=6454 RepID=UPI00201EBF4E|nr:DNA ligase 3-like [Haliotis rufescens]
MSGNIFCITLAVSGRSICRNCNKYIEKKTLRIGKDIPNPCDDNDEGWGDVTLWYHPACMFKEFDQEKAKERKIKAPEDLFGFKELKQGEKDTILGFINDANMKREDNSLCQFRSLCTRISEEKSGAGKTAVVSDYLKNGNSGTGFKGDVHMLMKWLLPGVVKTSFNLDDKLLVKLFSQIFGTNQKAMEEDLDQGDVSRTVKVCFEKSKNVTPLKESMVSLREINGLLTSLSQSTTEEGMLKMLSKIIKRCTSDDLMMVVRVIKHDLGINAKEKHLLNGLHPNAYQAFQISEDLKHVVKRVQANTLESMPGLKEKKTGNGDSDDSDSMDDLKKTPVKRPAGDEGLTTSAKKSKPECKTAPAASPSNVSANIFTGCKIFLPENTDSFKELKQYIIDFDGEVLSEASKRSATHIVSSKGKMSTASGKVKVVTPDWLWHSIKKKQLASTEEYKP